MNDKESKIAYLGLAVTGILIICCIVAIVVSQKNAEKKQIEAESVAEESQMADMAVNFGDPAGDAAVADGGPLPGEYAGDERVVRSFDIPLDLPYEAGDPGKFAELSAQYNKCIPFITNGMDESLYNGYTIGTKVDNSTLGDYAHGMTNQGYVVWLYRNVYGKAPDILKDFDALCSEADYVTAEDLKPGDIGMVHNEGAENNVFGVYVGTFDGKHMFSYCSAVPTKNIPMGTNHISYLKSEKDRYFNGSPAVDFNYFVRIQ